MFLNLENSHPYRTCTCACQTIDAIRWDIDSGPRGEGGYPYVIDIIIVLSLFIGAIFGGVVGNIFSLVLPESVVKDFFLTSISFDLGGLVNNDLGVFVIDLKIIVLKFGLSMSFNFTSVIGIAVAYYILRYLR